MLLRDEPQNDLFYSRLHDPRLKNSLVWCQEREAARFKKIQEQKQNREMLDHWPWGKHNDNKPRGLRNLRLEGLFPHQDFEKSCMGCTTGGTSTHKCESPVAKRTVLRMGRPGGGAPNVNEHGGRVCRTKEDPLLRFQWGKDLRQCVDNTLRYRMNKEEQAQYKQELDKLVAEKFKQKENERMENCIKDQTLGYTNGKARNLVKFDKIEKDTKTHANRFRLNQNGPKSCKNLAVMGGRNVNVVNPFAHAHTKAAGDQFAPLHNDCKVDGIELVPLMIEKRRQQANHALGTTDVTKNGYIGAPKWVVDGQIYLRELSKQMNTKLNELKELRVRELETTRKHFNTLDNFWGRPGHGAPRSALRKGAIDKMLFGGRLPVAVA